MKLWILNQTTTGSDNHKINGGTEKELQRSNPQYLEQTGVRMFKGATGVESPVFGTNWSQTV